MGVLGQAGVPVGVLTEGQALEWVAVHQASLVRRRSGYPKRTWYEVILPSGRSASGGTPLDAINSLRTYLMAQEATGGTRWYHALLRR